MSNVLFLVASLAGVALIVWGAELFAEHLAVASKRLGVTAFALALLLAGAEPEELATTVTASLRKVPAIAVGDVIGANVAICLVALGVGALMTRVPFGARVRRYGLAGLLTGALAVVMAWDGRIGRGEGALLVGAYVVFVVAIWLLERQPPTLGETGELRTVAPAKRVGRELVLVVAGVAAIAVGALLLVEGVRRLSGVESTQTRLGIIVVGFATAFELVVLAWSTARRGMTEAVVAAVVGSFAYNATMSLGAGALVRPLVITDAGLVRPAWLAMLGALGLVLVLAARGSLDRTAGAVLLCSYPVFVALVLVTT